MSAFSHRGRLARCLAGGALAACLCVGLPSAAQIDVTLIEAENVFTGVSGTGGSGVIVVRDGRIESIARTRPPGSPAPHFTAKAVTPGLIDARTVVGLAGLIREDDDSNETSSPNGAHLRAIDAFNLREPLLKEALRGGVTTIQSGPGRANSIGGQAAIFHTSAASTAEATIRFPSAVVFSLTEAAKTTYADRSRLNTRMANVGLIRQAFIDAEHHARQPSDSGAAARNLANESLGTVLGGSVPAVITAERVDEIATALRLRDEFKFRLVLAGVSDATLLASRLAKEQVPVLIGPPYEGPAESGTLQDREQLPARLHQAGVRFALASGDGEYRPGFGLLKQAAAAVSGGLPTDAALAAVTIQPARILGIDDRVGSIEPGKDADLVLYNGDPLSYSTRVTHVFIGGRLVFQE